MEKAGKVRRVKSVYARQICWQAVKQPAENEMFNYNGLKVFVSPLCTRQVQVKRHKRNKRINKKWIGRNARAVFRDVKQKAIEQGVTAEELRKAIARLP